VGRAVRPLVGQGQRKSQLQDSKYWPLICHACAVVAMVTSRCRLLSMRLLGCETMVNPAGGAAKTRHAGTLRQF
jgi:hypothetical protein